MKPSVKIASIHLAGVVDTILTPGNISFQDFFKKAESAIAETEKAEMQLRAVSTNLTDADLKDTLRYTEAVKSLLRELNTQSRHRLAASNYQEYAAEQEAEKNSDNEFLARSARDRWIKHLKQAKAEHENAKTRERGMAAWVTYVDGFLPYIAYKYGDDATPSRQKLQQLGAKYEALARQP